VASHIGGGREAGLGEMANDIESTAITSIDQTTFTVGIPGEFAFTTSLRSFSTSLSESGPLPCGVTFTDMGNGSAILAGTPGLGTVGRYPIRVTAFDGEEQGNCQEFILTIHRTTPQGIARLAHFGQGQGGWHVLLHGSGRRQEESEDEGSSRHPEHGDR